MAKPVTRVLTLIERERYRQDFIHGGAIGIDRYYGHMAPAILGEEFGEVCRAYYEGHIDELKEELIHVAAVAAAWYEEISVMGELELDD